MAVEKKPSDPSIYNDRSDIGSSEELDEYGVWVKSEPQDLSSEGNADSPDLEEPDFSDVSLDLPDEDEDPDEPPNFDDFPEEESLEDSELESAIFDEDDGPINNITVEEPDTVVDMETLKDDPEETVDELEGPLPYGEDTPEDPREGFSEISLEDFLDDAPESGAPEEPYATELFETPKEQPTDMNLSTELLSRIVEELGGIRNEIRNLKQELNALSQGMPQESDAGGFFDEDNDEKIALTGDELDNILQSADFTEESGSDEALTDDFTASLDELSQEEADPFALDEPGDGDLLDQLNLDEDEELLEDDPLNFEEDEGLLEDDPLNLDEEDEELLEDDDLQSALDLDDPEDGDFQDLLDDEGLEEDLQDPLDLDDGLDEDFDFSEVQDEDAGELDLEDGEVFDIDDELPDEGLSEELMELDEDPDTADVEEPSEELKKLMEAGAEPMTEAPDDTSYLDDDALEESQGLPDEDLAGDAPMDFSNAIIDEPDLSEDIQENPVSEPELDDIALELDLEEEPPLEEEAFAEGPMDIELELDLDDTDELGLDDFSDDSQDDLSFLEPEELDGIEEPLETDGAAEPLEDIPEDFVVEEDNGFPEIEEDDDFDDLLSDEEPELEPISFPEIEDAPLSLEEEENLLESGEIEPEELEADEPDARLGEEPESKDSKTIPDNLRMELRTVLSYMDQLLESLPEDKIEEFAKSEHFNTYKKLFEELGLS